MTPQDERTAPPDEEILKAKHAEFMSPPEVNYGRSDWTMWPWSKLREAMAEARAAGRQEGIDYMIKSGVGVYIDKAYAEGEAAGRVEGRAEQKERDAQIAREFEIKGFPSLSISLPVGNVGELISKEILTQEDKPL